MAEPAERKQLIAIPRAPALTDYVKQSIKEYILANGLRPGDAIPSEKELSQGLGVSRNSVREAVQALVSLGVLETRQGSGIYVRAFTLDPLLDGLLYQMLGSLREVSEFLQVRLVLEQGMIGEVLHNITDADIVALEDILTSMRGSAERGRASPDADLAFHHRLFEPAGNGVLLQLLDMFWLAYHKAQSQMDEADAQQSILDDHLAILAAVRARDVAAARQAIVRHYASAQERVRAWRSQEVVTQS